ncbi:metal-sensing transcriptional repressor [Sphingomonas molluscorum]
MDASYPPRGMPSIPLGGYSTTSVPASYIEGMSHNAHSSHPAIIKRLNRAAGHLRSIVGMIEEERPCVDIAQQLQAVESAIASAKRALINDHIDHCLVHAEEGEGTKVAVEQFRAISKYW